MFLKTKNFFSILFLLLFSMAVVAEESPMTVAGAITADTDQCKQLFDQEAAFIDLRKDSDWEAGRIPGAIHIELKKKYTEDTLTAEVKKDEPVVFYCNGASCLRASKGAKKAVDWGFTKVYYYRDGFPAWKAASLPVE